MKKVISPNITSQLNHSADSLVILDFETSGLSPNMGDRAIEIGAVRIENGEVTDSFQQLMNPGFYVSAFIENYTGITNEMLQKAPGCEEVMFQFYEFIGDSNLVAHNASFDQRFLDSELRNIALKTKGKFACSMLLARRIYQRAPNHQLSSLIRYKKIPSKGNFHRALYDSEMTAKLWMIMLEDIGERSGLDSIPFSMVTKLAKTPKKSVNKLLKTWGD